MEFQPCVFWSPFCLVTCAELICCPSGDAWSMLLSYNTLVVGTTPPGGFKRAVCEGPGLKLLYDWIKQGTTQQDTAKITCKDIHLLITSGGLMPACEIPSWKNSWLFRLIHGWNKIPTSTLFTWRNLDTSGSNSNCNIFLLQWHKSIVGDSFMWQRTIFQTA